VIDSFQNKGGLEMQTKAKGARGAAFTVLNRVEGGDAFADILLMKETEGLAPNDAGLATEIVYGVLRWKLRLDYAIDFFSSIRTKKLEHRVLNALRIGAYQLLFLDRVPAPAAINESVKLLRKEGARKAGFVNAVLRKVSSEKASIAAPVDGDDARRISIEWSHPEWLVKRWVSRYGAGEAEALCRANQEAPPRVVRVNTLATDRERLVDELIAAGYAASPAKYSPFGVEVAAGPALSALDPRYYIQDEASQLVSLLLSPEPGSKVLDACAAPGGKTTHLAQLMENRGSILALDRSEARLKSVEGAASRLGSAIIRTRLADASASLETVEEGAFDCILLDAPCTGLGVVRRSPDIRYRRNEKDIASAAVNQAALIENLARYLKEGGRLVYSTCSFEPEETDCIVEGFLERNPGYLLEDASEILPEACAPLVDEKGFFRPVTHEHGMDGFFGARIRRL